MGSNLFKQITSIEEEPGSHEAEKDEGTVETIDFDKIIDIPIVVVDH